jgi:hypothetical protein
VIARSTTCEYVSVSASLQQTIRDREVLSDPDVLVTAAVDDPCGKPADRCVEDRDGRKRSYCAEHLGELHPAWALARHP